MSHFEHSDAHESDIDLQGEYWQAYMALRERQDAEMESIRKRHFAETVSLHLDFPDDTGAVAFLEGVSTKPEGVRMIEEVRRQREARIVQPEHTGQLPPRTDFPEDEDHESLLA